MAAYVCKSIIEFISKHDLDYIVCIPLLEPQQQQKKIEKNIQREKQKLESN